MLFLLFIAILFPKKLLLGSLLNHPEPSQISLGYLKNLIKQYPDDTDLKMSLAEQETMVGETEAAYQLIAPYLTQHPQTSVQWKSLSLHYQIMRMDAFQLAETAPKRLQLEQRMLSLLLILANAPNLTAEEAAMMAKDALAFDKPKWAMSFYEKAIALNAKQTPSFYGMVGRAALFIQDYQSSAHFYLLAMEKSPTLEEKRAFYIKAIQSLKFSGNPQQAFLFAEQHGKEFKQDKITLIYLTQLAIEANQAIAAQQYIETLLKDPYVDQEIYDLAYTTYLLNKNIKKAFAIAATQVKKNPKRKLWHERLAQVAIWNGKPFVALVQYMYLMKQFNDDNAAQKGISLAKKLHDDPDLVRFLMYQIQQGHNIKVYWEAYVDAMLRMGNITTLVKILNKHRQQISPEFYLLSLAKLSHIEGKPTTELKYLARYAQQTGITPNVAKDMASIYLNQGQFEQAYAIMKQAQKKARSVDISFWEAFAKVTNVLNKTEDEIYAYQQLLKQKKPELPIYTRLVELNFKNDPAVSYHYAMTGRALYPNSYPLNESAFALLISTHHVNDFNKLLATTPQTMQKQLHFDNAFWNARANYWLLQGNKAEAIQSYLTGLSYLPEDNFLKSDFLAMLIELNEKNYLSYFLSLWQSNLLHTPELWGIYAQSYAKLPQPFMAKRILTLFYEQFNNYQRNPYWLIMFKDILENSFLSKQAAEITHFAWPVYLQLLRQQTTPPDISQRINYIKLSMTEASGDPTAIALYPLEKIVNNDVALLMLTWALGHQNFSLAKALFSVYRAQQVQIPGWVQLSIALFHHDKPAMKKLLISKIPIVSYRDRVRAAQEIDAIPLAQTIAYESLKHNRHDHDLYDNLYTPLMLSTAGNLLFNQDYYTYGSVTGPREELAYTYFFSPSISLTPYNSVWLTKNISTDTIIDGNDLNANNQTLASVPAYDERAGVKINLKQRRGALIADLGFRHDLSSFATAKLTRTYQVFHDLNTSTTIGWHQPADDTASLLVGGMENNVIFAFNKSMTPKDSLNGNFIQKFFYTQTEQRIGNGSQFTLNLEHKFKKTYPDWTLSPYGVISGYYDKTNQLFSGSVLQLVPTGVLPNVNFFIPSNFVEYGLTGSFGQSFIEDYTHRWQPFASLTVSKNSVVGLGELFNVGLAGTVFGRDHLLLFYEWGSNQGQGLQNLSLIRLSYKVYL